MKAIQKSIPVDNHRIIFLGVNVCPKGALELTALAAAGGDNAEFHNVNEADISTIFTKIRISLGIEKKHTLIGIQTKDTTAVLVQERNQLNVNVNLQRYAVILIWI